MLCEGLSGRTEAETVAQRLIDALTEPMARAGGITMTVSIGVAFAEPGVTAAELLRNADAAMYLAKTGGRDRFALFTPDLVEQATERLDLEHQLREAMRTEALFLDYQPVRRLSDGAIAVVREPGPLAAPDPRAAAAGRLPAHRRGQRPDARARPLRAPPRLRGRRRVGHQARRPERQRQRVGPPRRPRPAARAW